MNKTWTVGSCFAGIGGFELGLEWAFDAHGIDHVVKWQIEQNAFCQRILKKHWPDSVIHDDIKTTKEIEPVDIIIGGFPCQDISIAGKQKGIEHGKKSSLWFEMLRIISDIRPKIVVLENVPAIIRVGGSKVVGCLAAIGYDCEWTIVSAKQFGAPHLRKRWFCVATNSDGQGKPIIAVNAKKSGLSSIARHDVTDANSKIAQKQPVNASSMETTKRSQCTRRQNARIDTTNSWKEFPTQSPFCNGNDGVSDRVARLRALGNAIVPQCSQYVFEQIIKSGIIY